MIYRWAILNRAVNKPMNLVPNTTEILAIAIYDVNIVAEDLVQDRAMVKENIATVPMAIKNGQISRWLNWIQ